jgi:hypothetical protein
VIYFPFMKHPGERAQEQAEASILASLALEFSYESHILAENRRRGR